MSDSGDSDRDLPRGSEDANGDPNPLAAKEEDDLPPVADDFQDAPPSPETNSDGEGADYPDRAERSEERRVGKECRL